jgi:hypothetical protein
MKRTWICLVMTGLATAVGVPPTAQAQSRPAEADICITIDEARDTLSPQDRTASILLLTRAFEAEGRHVVPDGCALPYAMSHIRLGDTITVTLTRGGERRVGTAHGLDDLPALYSQMARSIVTGRPMTGFNVVDRTNVTASQESVRRVQSESIRYARLGYGGMLGDRRYGGPSMGLGYRAELDALGLDVSFLNFQMTHGASGIETGFAGSWLKLQGLHFFHPEANATSYVGAGLSWGGISLGGDTTATSTGWVSESNWHGSGLQSELTVGYEIPRASTLRVFIQADATLPLYKASSESNSYTRGGRIVSTSERRYMPSLTVSMGLGWRRHR